MAEGGTAALYCVARLLYLTVRLFSIFCSFCGEGGRLMALGLNSFEWLRSVDLRPVVALFWVWPLVSFVYFPPQHVDNTDPRNICLTACELLPCVVHGLCDCVGRCVE
ncbi:hypothetical protein TcG_13297 [Trypanosoma cruzi]|nr:hypothetical protein TcG_13297 [Trypanosoma cruzi]